MATDQNNQNAAGAPLEFPPELMARAREFFAKGAEVAYTLNYDYAVEVFLDGLSLWPDALAEGHKPLREIALRRQAAGQKKAGLRDSSKYRKAAGKSPKDAMLKAEYLLSKDPNNAKHLADMAKAAAEGEYRQTAKWITDIMFDVVRHKDKVSLQTYVFLRDTYARAQEFTSALQMCQLASNSSPMTRLCKMHTGTCPLKPPCKRASMMTATPTSVTASKILKNNKRCTHRPAATAQKMPRARPSLKPAPIFRPTPNVPGKINKLVAALTTAEDENLEKKPSKYWKTPSPNPAASNTSNAAAKSE